MYFDQERQEQKLASLGSGEKKEVADSAGLF